jgi:hypothetical protein
MTTLQATIYPVIVALLGFGAGRSLYSGDDPVWLQIATVVFCLFATAYLAREVRRLVRERVADNS